MSNLSILERLEDSLSAYAKGTVSRDAFVDFLSNSIRALEGVPLMNFGDTNMLSRQRVILMTKGSSPNRA